MCKQALWLVPAPPARTPNHHNHNAINYYKQKSNSHDSYRLSDWEELKVSWNNIQKLLQVLVGVGAVLRSKSRILAPVDGGRPGRHFTFAFETKLDFSQDLGLYHHHWNTWGICNTPFLGTNKKLLVVNVQSIISVWNALVCSVTQLNSWTEPGPVA